jgi:hypothetical protein
MGIYSADSADGVGMGLMSILKKMKQKEKDVRLLMLYPILNPKRAFTVAVYCLTQD